MVAFAKFLNMETCNVRNAWRADMLSRHLAKFVAALWKRIIYEAAHLVRHLFETKECVCPESGIVWCQNVNFVKSREALH